MIASVAFRNFKALRNTQVDLAPFNLVIGPNGSGKTSLVQALIRLRELSALPQTSTPSAARADGLELTFRFMPPYADIEAKLRCSGDLVCNFIEVATPNPELWADARLSLTRLRSYTLEHTAIARAAGSSESRELSSDGSNLGSMLALWRREGLTAFERVEEEFCRLFPEFSGLWTGEGDNAGSFGARLRDGHVVSAGNLSQGTLYTLALLALAFDPAPASVICIEELDRGIHPRMLREIRDLLYRLSYPSSFGEKRAQTQIIATTHSPYLLDLFRDHPEEVIIAQKHGQEARFERLADRADLPELLQEGALGDMWFAGILGGVPDETDGQGSGTPKLW